MSPLKVNVAPNVSLVLQIVLLYCACYLFVELDRNLSPQKVNVAPSVSLIVLLSYVQYHSVMKTRKSKHQKANAVLSVSLMFKIALSSVV